MWEFDSEVSEIIQRTPNIKSFRFPIRAKGVRYRSGQFFFITIKVKGEDAIHHFSFSSSPADKGYIEFTKRITASDFSQTLNAMKPGTWAHLQGPEGSFTLPRKLLPLAFLSGGIGITPLRSMLRYTAAKRLPYDVVLLYGNNNFEDIAFRDELDAMAASNANIRAEYTLSGPDFPPGWKGKKVSSTRTLSGNWSRTSPSDYSTSPDRQKWSSPWRSKLLACPCRRNKLRGTLLLVTTNQRR